MPARSRLAAACAAVALLLAPGSAAAAPRGGVIDYYESSVANGSGTVVVSGAIDDYGVDHAGALGGGSVNQIVLKRGSFAVAIAALGRAVVFSVDRRSCVYRESGHGTVRVLDGTGAYAGIRGSLAITVSGRGVLPRLAGGGCNRTRSGVPLVAVSSAQGSGTVSFG